MLRWISGVNKVERIRNERIINGTAKVGEISKKGKETTLIYEVLWACIEKKRRI